MAQTATISVVICTCDRASALRQLLETLQHQLHTEFEVIVVKGPCRDDTDAVLVDFASRIRILDCPTRNLSAARNLGIAAAAGELVAFIDDDSLPSSGWLSELAGALVDHELAGAGGLVYDRDGFGLQFRYAAADRLGRTRFDVVPPFDAMQRPGAAEFIYIQGTNQCYRRSVLVAAGGFDEAIEYTYDEADLCLRLLDSGLRVHPLPGASVIHQTRANSTRGDDGLLRDPRLLVKTRAVFALRHAVSECGERAVIGELERYVQEVADWMRMTMAEGKLDRAGFEASLTAGRRGLSEGYRAAQLRRQQRSFPAPDGAQYRPFLAPRPDDYCRVCFVSQELTPDDPATSPVGGVARYSTDLASGFARAGHEVHLITGGVEESAVGWENGMWVHRLALNHREVLTDARARMPAIAWCLTNAVGVWHEVRRIAAAGALDVVAAPLYRGQGLVCSLDPVVPVVTTLHTTFSQVAALHPSWSGARDTEGMLRLERATLERSRHVHALTRHSLEDIRAEQPLDADAWIEPVGVPDRLASTPPAQSAPGILFVGRLERRKGIDTLLEAFALVHAHCPSARLTLAGPDTPHTEAGATYQELFGRRAARQPQLRAAVTFLGPVDDARLAALYAASEFVCAPARYESFGLVCVEAMSFGKAVVACASGGTPEVIRDRIDGLLVAPDDPAALAGALTTLVEDPRLRDEMGRAARERFETAFALPAVVSRLGQTYREVAARGSGLDDAGSVQTRLAEVLVQLGVARVEQAPAMVADLLDPSKHPDDRRQHLNTLRYADDREFLSVVFKMLIGRPPSLASRVHYLRVLRAGGSRAAIVRRLARSPEALRRHGEPTWLDGAESLTSTRRERFSQRLVTGALRRAAEIAQRSSLYPIAVEVLRTQVRAAVADALAEMNAPARSGSETRPPVSGLDEALASTPSTTAAKRSGAS